MHFLAVTFYGLVIWLSVLAWAALAVLVLAPFVVSGAVLLLLAWCTLRWLWLSRGTLRLWRSPVPRADP